jgi:hypothetical protein
MGFIYQGTAFVLLVLSHSHKTQALKLETISGTSERKVGGIYRFVKRHQHENKTHNRETNKHTYIHTYLRRVVPLLNYVFVVFPDLFHCSHRHCIVHDKQITKFKGCLLLLQHSSWTSWMYAR